MTIKVDEEWETWAQKIMNQAQLEMQGSCSSLVSTYEEMMTHGKFVLYSNECILILISWLKKTFVICVKYLSLQTTLSMNIIILNEHL